VANVKRQSSAFNKAKKIFLLILFSLLLSFEVFSIPVSYDAKLSVENAVLNPSCSRVKGFLCKITKLSGILLANILLFFFSFSLFIKFIPGSLGPFYYFYLFLRGLS